MYLIYDAKAGREQIWVAVEDYGKGRVWEFYVHGITSDPRVVPSLNMACELLGADSAPILAICPQLGAEGPSQ